MSSIFLSYRRTPSKNLARLIYMALQQQKHDVFMDVENYDSGRLDTIILNQIAARPHFLLILSPGSLERCVEEGDWLRREIEEAFRLDRNILPIYDEGFELEKEITYLPEPLRTQLSGQRAQVYLHEFFDAVIEKINRRFSDEFITNIVLTPVPLAEQAEVQEIIDKANNQSQFARSKVYKLLPAPFDWVNIPEGSVTLGSTRESKGGIITKATTFDVPAFAIAKYPVTNAQFAKFIMDDGYDEKMFWTPEGWLAKKDNEWKRPRFWDDKNWKGDDLPVVGVSWYETVAFCRWLSKISGENITLPTDPEWQLAAQGDDDRAYPWGNIWDASRCNSSVKPNFSHSTTPVLQFEGQGDSPYSVVDMVGNVWEWCATAYKTGLNELDGTSARVVRGGAWFVRDASLMRVTTRDQEVPDYSDKGFGFRIVLK